MPKNVFVRPTFVYRHFEGDTGFTAGGHTHFVDHPTICASGAIRIDGGTEPIFLKAGEHTIVGKDMVHTVTATEDGTSWLCILEKPDGSDLVDFWGCSS
jgi:quercetin dioxygenase-like cupin family protein